MGTRSTASTSPRRLRTCFLTARSGVNHNTLCSQTLGTAQWGRVSLSGAKYLTGSTIHIAVEVHPDSVTAAGDDFKAIVIPMEQRRCLAVAETQWR